MRVSSLALRALGSWAEAARPLDTFVREVRSVLNGGATLTEQMAGEVKRGVRYVGGETLVVNTRVATTPLTVLCLGAKEALTDNPTFMSGGVVSWSYDNNAVSITDISGLVAATDYLVSLWIVEG